MRCSPDETGDYTNYPGRLTPGEGRLLGRRGSQAQTCADAPSRWGSNVLEDDPNQPPGFHVAVNAIKGGRRLAL
jgi:hypothetical protein